MAQSYQTSELVTVLSQIGEIEPVKLWTKLGREEYMRNYFRVLNARTYNLPLSELFKISNICFDNKALRSSFVTDNLWKYLGLEFIRKKENLSPGRIAEVVTKYALLNNNIKKQVFDVMEDMILELNQPQPVTFWSQVLWGYSFLNMGSEELYNKICTEIIQHPRLYEYPTKDISLLPYYVKRLAKDYKILASFSKRIGQVIAEKINEVQTIDDMLKISNYVFDGGIGMESDVIDNFEDKLYDLSKNKSSGLAKNITYLPAALSNHKIQHYKLYEAIARETKQHIRRFNLRSLVMGYKFYVTNTDLELTRLVQNHINMQLSQLDHSAIPFRILNIITKGIVKVGILDARTIMNLERLIMDQITHTNPTDYFLVYSCSMFNLSSIGSEKFYEAIRREFIQEHRLKSGHTSDLSRAIVVFGECVPLQNDELCDALDEKMFYFNRHMTGNQMAASTYSFARVNHSSPELFPLMRKRLVETHIDNLNNAAAGIWALTQMGADARQLIASALDLLADEEISYDRQIPEFNETRVRACALVQLAWSALLSGVTPAEYWEPYKDIFSQIEVSNSFNYSIDEFVLEIKLENREREILECIDRFHLPFYNQVCSMLNLPGKNVAPSRTRARHRDEVRKLLKPSAFKESVSDKHGTNIDFKIGKNALLLTTEKDYVYLSPGYMTFDNPDDLVGFQRFRRNLLVEQGYKVIDVPMISDIRELLIKSGLGNFLAKQINFYQIGR